MSSEPKMSTDDSTSESEPKQVYQVFFKKNEDSNVDILKFNNNIDFSSFENGVIFRENNLRVFKSVGEDAPKFGAGSEYGRDRKEEIRRLKYGMAVNKYDPTKQPYMLVDGKSKKKWKGIREGGVSDHADYFILVQGDKDQTFYAHPVESFHSFQAINRYKTLDSEEAEEAFLNRDKILNQFAFTMQQKVKENLGIEGEEEQQVIKTSGKSATSRSTSFITTMEDEIMSDADDDDDANENDSDKNDDETSAGNRKKKTQKSEIKKFKKQKALVSRREKESKEDSDEGDYDDVEIDYDYDSSDENEEEEMEKLLENELELKGMDELEADAENEDEEDDESKDNQENGDKDEEEDENDEKPRKNSDKKGHGKDKKQKDKKGSKVTKNTNEDDSDFSEDSDYSDSSDSDDTAYDNEKSVLLLGSRNKKVSKGGSNSSTPKSRSSTPVQGTSQDKTSALIAGVAEKLARAKRSASDTNRADNKRAKVDALTTNESLVKATPGTELIELIKRYLNRKPMTSTELWLKIKPHFKNSNNEDNVKKVAEILKQLNVHKQKVGQKMLISLK